MHVAAKRWMAAAAVAAAILVGSAGSLSAQAPAAANQRPADPPAIAYRKAMMNSNTQHIAALRTLLGGQLNLPLDVLFHTAALDANGKMFAHIFPEGSTGETSRAMAEIWSKKDDFAARVKAFADATHNLNAIAQRGFNDQTLTALNAVQATCGACHMPFRKPAAPTGG